MNTNDVQALVLSVLPRFITTVATFSSFQLTVKGASQIVLPNPQQFPSNEQLALFPMNDVEILKELWGQTHSVAGSNTGSHNGAEVIVSWPEFMTGVQVAITHMSSTILRVKIPYQPSFKQSQEMTELVRRNYAPTAVVELVYQPELVAGCMIELNGQRRDYSLETWLPQFMPQAAPSPVTTTTTTPP